MINERLRDRCRGSLIGGAVGDALGYAVEFSTLQSIMKRYGERGLTAYEKDSDGLAVFSDDTQMTLFTAEGLLAAICAGKTTDAEILPYITTAYEYWYFTQSRCPMRMRGSWLTFIMPLWMQRAPGMTCLSALRSLCKGGSASSVVNNSKGCGGVMRVAPIGIFSAAHPEKLTHERAGLLAGYAAEITHKHPLSTFSSMALAMIVAECITADILDRDNFRVVITDRVFKRLDQTFKGDGYLRYLYDLVLRALTLAGSDKSDADCISEIGEGWVAEETLAIAVFSVMRYIDDFEKCIVSSVNHNGDSDSTGAVAGNIIGSILGYEAIPERFKTDLQLRDLIVTVADDLTGESSEEQMRKRYVEHQPFNVASAYLM